MPLAGNGVREDEHVPACGHLHLGGRVKNAKLDAEIWYPICMWQADPNSIYFSESDIQRYRSRFGPLRADEPHLVYTGDPVDVIAAMEASQL